MQEFFVNNFRVDLLRSQIVREGEVVALEPKVLEVLQVLAESSGEVVSHQTLHDKVWPDTVVAPNALQRCIGQLRKAFNDDGKRQQVIVTHPKRGYSLIAPVSVRTSESKKANTESAEINVAQKFKFSSFIGPSLVVTLVFIATLLVWQVQKPALIDLKQFNQLSPLTATDGSEYYSVFSPDGSYLVFSRSSDAGGGHFWLKDLTTNQETQLTKQPGHFGQPNWSEDGKKIAFFDLAGCLKQGEEACKETRCFNINTLFIPMALNEPQNPSVVLSCVSSFPQGLQWTSDKDLAFIEQIHEQTDIIELDTQTRARTMLYSGTDLALYSLSYSFVNQTLAVMQESQELEHSLLFMSLSTGEKRQLAFPYPVKYGSWLRWYPVWNADGNGLMFSAASRLYHMDLAGNVEVSSIPTFLDISRPMLHPKNKNIAMTLGKVDRDLALLQLSEDNELTQEQSIGRSILRESDAQFQPNGKGIAFISERSGSRQLWHLVGSNSQKTPQAIQLTRLDNNQYLESFVWSPNGKQMAALTEDKILLVDTAGRVDVIHLPVRAIAVYQWSEGDQLLMSVVDEDGVKLVSFDLNTSTYLTHYHGHVKWAQQVSNFQTENLQNEILFTDLNNKVMSLKDGTTQRFFPFVEITTWSRYFVRGDELYVLSSEDDVWLYQFSSDTLTKLFHYPDTSVALTDVQSERREFLISQFVSAKKEIVLLEPITD